MLLEKEKMSFKKSLIIKNIICIGLIACGCIALGFVYYSKNNNLLNDFAKGFYIGTGGGFIGAGVVTIVLNIVKMRDEKKLKQAEIESRDERNKMIVQKSLSVCFIISVFVVYLAVVISGFINIYVFKTLLAVFMMQLLSLFITFAITKKIM